MALISLGSNPANNLGSNPNPAIILGSNPANNLGSSPAKSLGSNPAMAAIEAVEAAAEAAADVGVDVVIAEAAVEDIKLADEAVIPLPSNPATIFGSIPAACKSLGSIPAKTFGSNPVNPIMDLGSNPSILGSSPANALGSRPAAARVLGSSPAALKRLGSIPANILGSIPKAKAALFKDVEGVEVLGADEVFGDLRWSLLAEALDGGRGEARGELAPVLDVVGVVLVLAFEPWPMNISMPGIPAIMAGL